MIENYLRSLKNNGISQREVAKRTGYTESFISALAKGSACSVETLIKIADSFGVSTDEVLGRSPEKRTVTPVESLLLDVTAGDEELTREVLRRAEVEKLLKAKEGKGRGEKAA